MSAASPSLRSPRRKTVASLTLSSTTSTRTTAPSLSQVSEALLKKRGRGRSQSRPRIASSDQRRHELRFARSLLFAFKLVIHSGVARFVFMTPGAIVGLLLVARLLAARLLLSRGALRVGSAL